MNKFDRKLKNLIKKEVPELPEDVSERIDRTVENLCAPKKKKNRVLPVLGRVAVIAVLVMIILPNISRDVAYAMLDVPVLGDIVKVVTVWELHENNDRTNENVRLPEISGSDGIKELISGINKDIQDKASEKMQIFEKDSAELTEAHFSLSVDYDVVTDTDDWFTLKFMISEASGSSNLEQTFYHIDKKHCRRVTLSNLFKKDFDYVTVFSDYIYERIKEEMAENSEVMYWTKEDSSYFKYEGINAEQNFYFNADGDLVIVFDKYQIAPGAMGCPEFVIPKSLYEGNLAE
mgnify:FL=1